MNEIIDKLLIFVCSFTLYLFQPNNSYYIVPVILSVLLSSLSVYYEDYRIRLAGNLIFAVFCLFFPGSIIFLPLLMYDLLHSKYKYVILLLPFFYLYHWPAYTGRSIFFSLVLLLISYMQKHKTDKLNKLNTEYNELRDTSAAMSLLLEEKNQSLLRNQDYEINLAKLNERNRISKEIHDNVGHLLSRALLQVGALLTLTKEEVTKDALSSLKTSLSDGMDQIRNSIHNMYDESIDLYAVLEGLVKDFTFCPIQYEYDFTGSPPIQLKHCIIGITKEALANILRHSNATKVSLLLREHPVMYQLIIQDNGKLEERKVKALQKAFESQEFGDGMGLRNIAERVKSFGGNINLSLDNGFKLFLTFPKNRVNQEKKEI